GRPKQVAVHVEKCLQVVRHLLRFVGGRRSRSSMPWWLYKRRALYVGEGRRCRKRRQVVSPHLCCRLETGRQLDQCGLAEGRPEEADPQRETVLRAILRLRG